MKIFQAQRNTFIHNREILPGSIVCALPNGTVLSCYDFRKRDGKILVYFYMPSKNKWAKAYQNDKITDAMIAYHNGIIKKEKHRKTNFSALMTHDRVHKHGTGGVRLEKFCGQVTDYECTKNPMHDFRRVYN